MIDSDTPPNEPHNNIVDNSERVAAGLATPLPDGFSYAKADDFPFTAIEDLFRTAYTDEQVWNMYLPTRDEDLSKAGLREADIAISFEGRLVAFANIISREGRGEMGDLVVHPAAQHQKLAQTLTLERLAIAEQQGITSLFIPPITDQNTLGPFYIENGFTQNPDGSFSRGPDPRPVLYQPEEQ